MKKKHSIHLGTNRSNKNKKRRSSENLFSSEHLSKEEFLDTLTESLSNQLEDVTGILNGSTPFSKANPFTFNSNESNSSFKNENNTSQNTSSTNSSPSSKNESNTSQGPSGYNYAGEPQPHYRFGFTNSEFIAFLGSLNAVEYIIVLSIITVLIMITLNEKEREIVFNFFITIGQTMGSGIAQTVFQKEISSQEEDALKDTALQTDFGYIYTEMTALQNEIKELKEQLKRATCK